MPPYTHWFIRARLKTRQLLLLVALAEEGNIHRAAQVLNMTQPAASKLLKDLEDVLEVELFERLPRGMRPTWYGESMIRHARMVLANLGQAYDEISAIKAGLFGQVGVGAITSPGIALLPQAVSYVKQAHPNLNVSLEIDTSPVLMDRLAQGKLDMVVARLNADHDKAMYRYEPLSDEPVCALVRCNHPLLSIPGLTLRDVDSAGWIVPPAGSVLRHRFDLMFQEKGLAPPINLIETSSQLFITKMLEQSDTIAVLSTAVGQYYASHGVAALLPLEMQCNMDAFGIITRRDQLPSPGARAMMRALQSASLDAYGRKINHEWAEA
ncbi:LysR family transcriptional regulator [Paraburkholderia dinghuensis]|uniref:LysR family transcriptional regulator n=1 Tax=Paraburkholderia dinghuensis TaxID=2305225 RepID=A0A3N6N044_9BURK|nr:LysR family transcriptional regulator [Paraburkholderia dinghuensis]RQH02172.1 LysR family transcriptional regulator [Paraburkholderia dinghuensis]